jgi:hypothetical protein
MSSGDRGSPLHTRRIKLTCRQASTNVFLQLPGRCIRVKTDFAPDGAGRHKLGLSSQHSQEDKHTAMESKQGLGRLWCWATECTGTVY